MSTVAVVALLGLSVAAVLALVRLALGPSVPDRIVALDNLLLVVVGGIAVGAADSGEGDFLAFLKADPEVTAVLPADKLEPLFDLGYHTKHVDTIFARVFG